VNQITCTLCKETKQTSEFSPRPKTRYRTGFNSWCKECCSKRTMEHYRRGDNRLKKIRYEVERQRSPDQKRLKRSRHLRKNFGMTIEEFDQMLEKQGGRCAICNETWERTMHVDHCHKTGRIRGLLCSTCNTGIGMLKDSKEIALAAARYLE
jgi:hypothetical protein